MAHTPAPILSKSMWYKNKYLIMYISVEGEALRRGHHSLV